MVTRDAVRLRTLERARTILGVERLRMQLRVPVASLDRWLRGEEAVPPDIFLKVVDLVLDHDLPRKQPQPSGDGGKIQISVGSNFARCPDCDCTEFRPADPAAQLNNRSLLICTYCGRGSVRGDLVVSAADDGAKRGAAAVNRLKRQQNAQQEGEDSNTENGE